MLSCQHLLGCNHNGAIRCAREGAAGIGGRSSQQAASTTIPQALVRIGVEQRMTRKDILFTTTATYCIRDVYRLLFVYKLGADVLEYHIPRKATQCYILC